MVATRCGGSEDIVQDGVTGFLVSRDDPTEKAAALEQLLTDGGLRERMGQAGRERVCKEFSTEVVGARILATYRQVYPDLFAE